jgi:endo-beta-N-acetylglucosaminidase D
MSNLNLNKYIGRSYSYSIQSVYGLLEWNDTSDSNRSKTPLKINIKNKNKNKNKNRLLVQYKDIDYKDNKYVNGSNNPYYYNFNHWQYVDIFIYTANGLFDIPASGYINAAHLNGVKILGTLMAPVNQSQCTNQFKYLFKEKNGVFSCVNKMVKIMEHYGFDGWFINIEEMLPDNITWMTVQKFVLTLNKESKKVNPNSEIHWYDSNYIYGSLSYENELNKKNVCMFQDKNTLVTDGFFINYSWNMQGLQTSVKTTEQVKRNLNDVYVGMYLPELEFSDTIKEKIKCILKQNLSIGLWGLIYQREKSNSRYQLDYNNEELWSQISTVIKPKTIDNTFNTCFSDGFGYTLYGDGIKLSNYPWGCMSQQDIMLSGAIKKEIGQYKCNLTHDLSFEGGSSIMYRKMKSINGNIGFLLFETDIVMEDIMIFKIVVHNEGTIKFDIIFDYNGDKIMLVDSKINKINGWTEYVYQLEYANKCHLSSIYLSLKDGEIFDSLYLGKISLLKKNEDIKPEKITNLIIKDEEWIINNFSNIYVNLTLEWTYDKSKYYDIYYKRPDYGYPLYLARSYSNIYRIEELYIKGDVLWDNNDIYFYVYPMDYNGNVNTESPQAKITWEPKGSYLDLIEKEPIN